MLRVPRSVPPGKGSAPFPQAFSYHVPPPQGSNPALAAPRRARASLPPDCERLPIKDPIFLKGCAPPPLPPAPPELPAASVRGTRGGAAVSPSAQLPPAAAGSCAGGRSTSTAPSEAIPVPIATLREALGVPVRAPPLPVSLTTQPDLENTRWFNREQARPISGRLLKK